MAADIFAELAAQISTAPSSPIKEYSDGNGAAEAPSVAPTPTSADGFPAIPEGFVNTPLTQGPKLSTPPSPVDASKIDRSERLETLIDTSLTKAEELLAVELVPGDQEFAKIASMQKDLVVSILNTGVKVDENRFKKKQTDALTGILKDLLTREKQLGPLIDLPAQGHG